MNILFLTIGKINDLNGNGLYIDLINELNKNDNKIFIICPNERRTGKQTYLDNMNNVEILRVKTGNITKTNFIEKGLSTVLIEKQFINAIKKYYSNIKFDLVMYSTPPVTFAKIVSFIKKRDDCLSYLILKDIFPQNAVDLGIMNKYGLFFRYFRLKEKNLYAISDYIGCTSNENINFILKNNPSINREKVELFPNSISPRKLIHEKTNVDSIRKKFGIPLSSVVFVYGGNIGKPQGVDFIKLALASVNKLENTYTIILGSGTEYENLSIYIKEKQLDNVQIQKSIPQNEYWEFLKCCDVGLIFLDHRFTVPNTPARLTYYMEAALPIIAATDKNTDIKDILEKAGCGYWTESTSIDYLLGYYKKLAGDKNLRIKMGNNGREFLMNNFTIDRNAKILEKHLIDWRLKNV